MVPYTIREVIKHSVLNLKFNKKKIHCDGLCGYY
mgnify:CR=1 FL=1